MKHYIGAGNPMRAQFEAKAPYEARHFAWSYKAGVGTITLNRPERKNPLTFESYAELRDLFRQLKYADDVHAVVVHGAGDNFCSGGDDRLRAGAHRLDQIARQAREGEQSFHVARQQRADDLVHVAARREVAAVGREDDGLDVVGAGQRPERVAQLRVRLEGERVLALGPRQRDDGDAALDAPVEVDRTEIAHRHTFVGVSARPVTR